jgi:hypothetical protein
VPDILQIALTFETGIRAKKGEKFDQTAAYLRHQTAPYAYDYNGRLYKAFWPFRLQKNEDGERILNDTVITKICSTSLDKRRWWRNGGFSR